MAASGYPNRYCIECIRSIAEKGHGRRPLPTSGYAGVISASRRAPSISTKTPLERSCGATHSKPGAISVKNAKLRRKNCPFGIEIAPLHRDLI
jgi:hypothetical protein